MSTSSCTCNKCDLINRLLLYDIETLNLVGRKCFRWSFFIHSSISLAKFKRVLDIHFESYVHEFNLQVGDKFYDMHLVSVKTRQKSTCLTIPNLLGLAQCSFPWEKQPTLFINISNYNVLRDQNLEAFVMKIDEQPGLTLSGELIKVVTFNEDATKMKLNGQFQQYIKLQKIQQPVYYYMTIAFPWLHQKLQNIYKIPIDELTIYSGIPVFLNHLSRYYTNALSLFDLVSLRLAFCDFRYSHPIADQFKYEIDYYIRRALKTVIHNKHLDLQQYLVGKNIVPIGLLISYLIYEFQNHFDTVTISSKSLLFMAAHRRGITATLVLTDEPDVLQRVREKCNVQFKIDGKDFDQMNLSMFLELFACDNVKSIILDTNHVWLDSVCVPRNRLASYDAVKIYFIGRNRENYIEKFLSAIKTIEFLDLRFALYIFCDLNDYSVFDNLKAKLIYMSNIKVSTNMLETLVKCDLQSTIDINYCTFQNSVESWQLLNRISKLQSADVRENEDTWPYLFQFVTNMLQTTNLSEFRFNTSVTISNAEIVGRIVKLRNLIFTTDPLKSILQIKYAGSGLPIDLYYLKNYVQPDDHADYEFYQ